MIELIELGKECEIITKGTTPTTLGKKFKSNGVGFLRAQNIINNNVLINDDILYIDNETHNNELKRSQIYDGDVLLTIAGTIGRTAIVKNIDKALNCNQAVAIIRLGNSKINKEYLCHFIASPIAQEQFFKGMVTATIPNLSLAQVRKLQIPLPPLETQQKIAAILDAADTLRQKDKALVAKYDELTQALFLDMFGDPVSNPKGWEIYNFGKVVLNKDSKRVPIKSADRDLINGIYPYYGASGIIDYVDDFVFEEENLLIGEDGANLITRNSPIAFIASGKYWVNNHAHVLGFNGVALLIYLKHYINSINLEPYITGSAQPKLNRGNMDKIIVSIPPLSLQTQFAERVAIIEKQKAIAQASLEKSEGLFNSLLQKAFKGELV